MNVPGAGQVVVVADGKQVAAWPVPGLSGNFPMALDAGNSTLATVFRSPARLVLLSARLRMFEAVGFGPVGLPSRLDVDQGTPSPAGRF